MSACPPARPPARMYACINALTKVMYFQKILYLLGVNKYYGYGYMVMVKGEQSSTAPLSFVRVLPPFCMNFPQYLAHFTAISLAIVWYKAEYTLSINS